MNTHWFHLLKGKYDIAQKTMAIDFAKLMGSSLEAQLTLFHESTHGLLAAETDFGQATHIFYKLIDFFTHVDSDKVAEMTEQLYITQVFTQEGFATLMQYIQAKNKVGRAGADKWMSELSYKNPQCHSYLQKLVFVSSLGLSYREFFTKKISSLAMETGIRRQAQQQDIFRNPEALKQYFADEDNIPDKRLEKIIGVLRYKTWLVTKPIPEIAASCGVRYNDPSTKEEVAEYMSYLTSLTDKPHTYISSDIKETPQGNETLQELYENMMVANINVKFDPSEFLKIQDFLHYADKYEIVLAVLNDDVKHWEFAKQMYEEEPEVIIYGFLGNGEKYVTVVAKSTAEKVLNNELKDATLAVKWGGYNAKENKHIWSDSVRVPNLVIYNTPAQLKATLEAIRSAKPDWSYKHLHAGAMEDHPFQSLFVKIDKFNPFHVVNHFGNKSILNVLDVIREKSVVMENDYLLENKKHINNLMAFWMGLYWEVDWVKTMIDADTPHFR